MWAADMNSVSTFQGSTCNFCCYEYSQQISTAQKKSCYPNGQRNKQMTQLLLTLKKGICGKIREGKNSWIVSFYYPPEIMCSMGLPEGGRMDFNMFFWKVIW